MDFGDSVGGNQRAYCGATGNAVEGDGVERGMAAGQRAAPRCAQHRWRRWSIGQRPEPEVPWGAPSM